MLLVLLLAIGFGLNYAGFLNYQFFTPKYVGVQNQVFHESAQYIDGMNNDLADLQVQYINCKTDVCHDSIKAIIHQRFASFPGDKFTPSNFAFYNSL